MSICGEGGATPCKIFISFFFIFMWWTKVSLVANCQLTVWMESRLRIAISGRQSTNKSQTGSTWASDKSAYTCWSEVTAERSHSTNTERTSLWRVVYLCSAMSELQFEGTNLLVWWFPHAHNRQKRSGVLFYWNKLAAVGRTCSIAFLAKLKRNEVAYSFPLLLPRYEYFLSTRFPLHS